MRLPLSRPPMRPYDTLVRPPGEFRSGVRATFLGTSSVLVRDERTALLVDGFFSRPSLPRIATGRIGPDRRIIDACLSRARVTALDAVLCAHTHYDHALDSPVIAQTFDAPLIGSESAVNLGRGYGLPDRLLVSAGDGQTFVFGDFEVTLVHALHSPGDIAPGGVDVPFTPPARYRAWRSGQSHSIFFKHPAGTLHVHASANYVPGTLDGHRADTVYLSIGRLGKQSERFREEYWRETVRATGATTVLPVHWDDFMKPLDRPLVAPPYLMDDIESAMDFLIRRCRQEGVALELPIPWQETDPFGRSRPARD